jgi:hypothetical protein
MQALLRTADYSRPLIMLSVACSSPDRNRAGFSERALSLRYLGTKASVIGLATDQVLNTIAISIFGKARLAVPARYLG